MSLTLRPATNDDGEAIRSLVFGVLREHGLEPDPTGTDADLYDIESSYGRGGGCFDVLVDESGHVVGSVALFRISDVEVELRKMYLLPGLRGQGWGRRLLEHALARAAERGFRRIVLETASVLRSAVALYERFGFRRHHPTHLAARADAAYFLDLP